MKPLASLNSQDKKEKKRVYGEIMGSRPTRSSALGYWLLDFFAQILIFVIDKDLEIIDKFVDVSYLDSKSKGSNKGSSHPF